VIPKFSDLQRLSDDQLIAGYDDRSPNTEVGTGFYLDELHRRAQARQNDQMLALTRQMRGMTIAITALTIINAVLVGVTIWIAWPW
jgi:hypothetical protein